MTSDRSLAACPTPPVAPSFVIDDCALCLNEGQTRSPNEGRWYNFSASASAPLFYAYSAFYDDRPLEPVVRIGVIETRNSDGNYTKIFDCLLLFADGRVLQVSERVLPPEPIGAGFQLHQQYAKEYIFTCRLPPIKDFSGGIPVGVSVRLVPNDTERLNNTRQPFWWISESDHRGKNSDSSPRCFMPVEIPSKPSVRRNMAVCVKIVSRNPDPSRLVEWLELQRLLGVELVGIYTSPTVGQPAMNVFHSYAKQDDGLVELRAIDYIGPPSDVAFNVTASDQYRLLQSMTINDCIYRHMHTFKYIGVYDFDEVLVTLFKSR